MENQPITITTTVSAPIRKVWEYWTHPRHIVHWNAASDDWECPQAKNDLRPGGTFSFTMAARDGSFRFDFEGVYDVVEEPQSLSYTLGDGRQVEVRFEDLGHATRVTETFDPEQIHSTEMQRAGWQAILDRFGRYAENQ